MMKLDREWVSGIILFSLCLIIASPAQSAHFIGFEKKSRISGDIEFLSNQRFSASYFLPKVELSNNGKRISRRINNRFPLIIAQETEIRRCSRNPYDSQIARCEKPFDKWDKVKPALQKTPFPGVALFSPAFQWEPERENVSIIGFSNEKMLTVDNKSQVLMVISSNFIRKINEFDTSEAKRHLRISAYIGAARVFDAFVGDKKALFYCSKGYGHCSHYSDGAITQSAGYLLSAGNECQGCSSKDKARLFSVGLRLLTAAPPDAKLNATKIYERIRSVVGSNIVPEPMIDRLREEQMLLVGMSPEID